MPKVKSDRSRAIHPNSRAAAQQARKAHHDDRVDKRLKEKTQKVETQGDKLLWFQRNLDPSKTSYTKAEACSLVNQYLSRFEDELEQIAMVNDMKGRTKCQHAARKQAIKMTLEVERQQYETSGFEIPDIINGKNLSHFRDWNGHLRFITNLKMKKLLQSDETKDDKSKGLENAESTDSTVQTIEDTKDETEDINKSDSQEMVTE